MQRLWAVAPDAVQMVEDYVAGKDTRLLRAFVDETPPATSVVASTGNAVVHIRGLLTHGHNPFGTSVERVAADVDRLSRDPKVRRIVLAVDSPGGSVYGLQEAAAVIRDARKRTHIVSVAAYLSASAAYYLASQATECAVSPSGEVGSIGCVARVVDASEALAREGIKVHVIRSPGRKAWGHPFEAPDDEALAEWQEDVDAYTRRFEVDVSLGRRVSVEKVRSDFGEGRTFRAEDALARGLVDRVATLGEVMRAADDWRRSRARAVAAGVAVSVTS